MATHRSSIHLFRFVCLLFLIGLGARQVSAPIAVSARADTSGSNRRPVLRPSAPAAAGTPAARELFQKHCVKCHGADGTGRATRDQLAEVPDFTDASWHARRSDARLLASILKGREPDMPGWRAKISEEQARGLVAQVRAFSPTQGTPEGASPVSFTERYRRFEKEPEGPIPAQPAKAKPPRGFFEKLIPWLGKFHPAAVHFPIALLMAAAVAELLGIATGQRTFDAVSRCVVWFGTFTAVVAGVLGWFLVGFRLTDSSRILMMHRWLGTTTVACAGLLLVLSEVSRRPDRHRTRIWFRVTLLVVAVLVSVTGFFGGALVFGLDHYAWPP